jgi:uncharacterized membrane protein
MSDGGIAVPWHKYESMSSTNVGKLERITAGVAGITLFAAGLMHRRLPGYLAMIAGGAFMCLACRRGRRLFRLAHSRISVPGNHGINVDKTIFIGRPADELYRTWRNFENLPHFMEHLEEVRVVDEKRSHWRAKAPAGTNVQWDAEIINEHPNEMISWRSLEGADVDNAGTVRFQSVPGGTEVRVTLEYNPPGGAMGAALARFFREEPGQQLEEDLLRFKHLVESAG